MISVVCVFNNAKALRRILLPSLMSQCLHQLILLDNTDGRFRSAATALNYGASLAHPRSRYIMFVHQDVELGSPHWLEDAEYTLDGIRPLGIAGVIGMSTEGSTYEERLRGHISNAGQDWGKELDYPGKVQTLDELLLIVPRDTFQGFDEKTFDGWHCYGCDYAMTMNELGLGAYVIPGYVYHRSLATNMAQLRKYHLRLFWKHRRYYPRVFATSGGITWWNSFALPFIPPLVRLNHLLFPNWIEVAKRELRECQSILDLGCGYNSPIQFFGIPQSTGVEIHEPYLTESRMKAIHTDYVQADIRTFEFPRKSYDAVFASEVLEHMTFLEGVTLLDRIETWARRKIILTTPNGAVFQDGYDGNPFQAHQSAWTPADFRCRGYRVLGMSGLKMIRGYKGQLTLRPEFLGMRVASLSQKVTRYLPQLDFQLLAIKELR